MAFLNETTVKVPNVKITWDGLTNPDRKDDGSVSYNLGFAIADAAPELQELAAIAQNALNASDFKGVLPAGANPALRPADVAKFGPLLTAHQIGNASTSRGIPPCFDEQGKQIGAEQLKGILFPGCEVSILVHAYAYNNKSKGVKFGLDGLQIVNRAADKLDVAGGMSVNEVANAFGAMSMAPASQPAVPGQPGTAPSMIPPQVAQDAQTMAPAPAVPAAPPAPPANDLAAGKVMTPAANGIPYETYISQGWTDELLIQHGYMAG